MSTQAERHNPHMWIDTHCHLDAPEFGHDAVAERDQARSKGVDWCVYPAVVAAHFEGVRALAHTTGDAYALGLHPLYVSQATDEDLTQLDLALTRWRDDPRLVAVGEIGLDFFVPALCTPNMRDRQTHFYREQLRIARRHGLPVILHVRRSADQLLKYLRQTVVSGGIAHAFNGSDVQARAFTALGFKLGFGGTLTFDAARQLRRLATTLPLDALVLETDAPDIPPQWLYTPAAARAAGTSQGRNSPAELPRIGAVLAYLRGMAPDALARATSANACQALPRLAALTQEAC